MRPALKTLSALLLLALGFVSGYWCARYGDLDPRPPPDPARRNLVRSRHRAPAPRETRRDLPARERRVAEIPGGEGPEGAEEMGGPPPPAALLAQLEEALGTGDEGRTRHLLHELSRRGAEALAPDEAERLAGHLSQARPDLVHDIARALVTAGGEVGLRRVMDFAGDAAVPLEARRSALFGLGDIPREKAPEVAPALADFLETGPPRELEHAAAHAIGRMFEEEGGQVLLGLLTDRPAIRTGAIFDAVGDVGAPAEREGLLELLPAGWSREEKLSLLRAAGRISARAGEPGFLVGLLGQPPAGTPRELVAHALSDMSHEVGTDLLAQALARVPGDRQAQEWIARALTRTGGREGLEILAGAAGDPEIALDRRVFAEALHEFPGRDALPYMLELFRSSDPTSGSEEMGVLETLARGLARHGGRETVGEFLAMLEGGEGGPGAWRRRALARALEEAGGDLVSPERLLELLSGEKDQDVASSLVRALDRLHPDALAGRAGELLEGASSPAQRVAFARALEARGDPAAAAAIGRSLEVEAEPRARWELARILGRLGGAGVERVGEILSREPEVERRHPLLWGLEASRRPMARAGRELVLEVATRDPSPEIRGEAAEILARQADPSVIPRLEELLQHESHPAVQERIRRAIEDLQGP